MKKGLLMALLLTMFLGMQAQTGKRMLVTYFSWSGSTKNLAEEIQRQTNADIYRIEPLVPYTDDYQELAYQISNKEKEENARPALKDTLSTLNDYDIIFVGCPVWWFDAPMIILSFLECNDYNFSGKTVIPFSSHGGSGWSGSLNVISQLEPEATMVTGFSVSRERSVNSAENVRTWLQQINMLAKE